MNLITRTAAHRCGATRFYTGTICERGHDSPRYTCNGQCIACTKHLPATHPIPSRPDRLPSFSLHAQRVDWSHLTTEQLDSWYAKVDAIQRRCLLAVKRKKLCVVEVAA
jgi:hypothetical protein